MKPRPKNWQAAVVLLIASALAHAPFAQADAQMIAVGNCNGGMSLLFIPGKDDAPGDGGNGCAKACHGSCERRTKPDSKKADPLR